MNEVVSWLRMTELDRTNLSAFAERVAAAEEREAACEPRRYPGYPTWELPRVGQRWSPSLDAALTTRRSSQTLATDLPERSTLARLLHQSHGAVDSMFRGPTPSAGGLQAIELYLAHWQDAWLPPGVFHYDRRGHALAQIVAAASYAEWSERVPSLHRLTGGGLLWLVVGDYGRVQEKYGERAERFLLLEAGHLMQNLCLVSASLRWVTVPLGGCLEQETAGHLRLPDTDRVLYVGVCGRLAS